ncbi:lantibiotic dehydratase [Streptomyces hundungensis]|uniref:lantibiotic dehydratase n=1 Tax=Streptomyces hundungensis TaxID=1077946 RepID=UPI0033F18F99
MFERVGAYDRARRRQADRARALAEQVGDTVIPRPELSDADRGKVLALRRRLHGGAAPGAQDCELLQSLAMVPEVLVEETVRLHRDGTQLARTRQTLDRAVAEEVERVGGLGWALACRHPVMRAFLDDAVPELALRIERQLAQGELWSGKRLRKSSAYLWRALGRAAAKTTPRGWVGQVAPVAIGSQAVDGQAAGRTRQDEPPRLLAPGTALDALAAEVSENVHAVRTRLSGVDLATADPETLLAPAPLHFFVPGQDAEDNGTTGLVRCSVVDPSVRGRMRQVELRRTRPLDAVLVVLAHGPRPLEEIEATLLGPQADADGAVRGFLAHLHQLGVLQVCATPRRRHSGWLAPDAVREQNGLPRPKPLGTAQFVDSYRMAQGAAFGPATVPAEAADAVRDGLRIAARLAALREADHRPDAFRRELPEELQALDEHPRALSELLTERGPGQDNTSSRQTDGHFTAPERRRYEGWHPARTAHSGYSRLLAHLATRCGEQQVDITDALLDAFDAPPGDAVLPPWPVDCVLRPLAGPGPSAVLETASPAGILDARFADTLHALHGGYGNTERYRAFLAAVEREADVDFVEVLVPPLAERAANAVRRPLLTSWWTGDPDPAPYFGTPSPAARYLPLDRITLRRDGGQVIAEADGRRIVPIHHATRNALPPYDALLRLLMAASHPGTSYLVRLDGLAGAFPRAERLPRLTVGGRLTVSAATWRLPCTALWCGNDRDLDKIRDLTALRREVGLPRYAFLRHGAGAKPVPVDFTALPTLRIIDRLLAQGDDCDGGVPLLVEEMLPAPDALVLRDRAYHNASRNPSDGAFIAAQLLLRLPHDRAIQDLAAPAAAVLRDGTHLPEKFTHSGRIAGADPIH